MLLFITEDLIQKQNNLFLTRETSSVSEFLPQGMLDFSTLISNLDQDYSGQLVQSDDSSKSYIKYIVHYSVYGLVF